MKSNFKVGQAVEVLRYTPAVRGTIKYICKYTAEELQREETIQVTFEDGRLEFYAPKELRVV